MSKIKLAKNVEAGERINTTSGVRAVIAVERYDFTTNIVVQCPASPATARAPLGKSTIRFDNEDKVEIYADSTDPCKCSKCEEIRNFS